MQIACLCESLKNPCSSGGKAYNCVKDCARDCCVRDLKY